MNKTVECIWCRKRRVVHDTREVCWTCRRKVSDIVREELEGQGQLFPRTAAVERSKPLT